MLEAPNLLMKARETMLERSAERDVEKERAMKKTVDMFNAAFPSTKPVTEYQGWMFMLFLKLARAHGGNFREDDYVDASAYVALAGECRGNEALPKTTAELLERHITSAASVTAEAQGWGKL
jgi:hypothetical protein